MCEKAEPDLWIDSLLWWNHCARVVVSPLSRFLDVVFYRFGPTFGLTILRDWYIRKLSQRLTLFE